MSGGVMPIEEELEEQGVEEEQEEAEEAHRKAEVRAPTEEEVRKHNVPH